jgi:two-component system, NarL family, invasion response regulator UvrY
VKPRLVIAEDHPAVRAMVTTLLQGEFDVVSSGSAAVEAAGKAAPDVLVLDVSMPVLDGSEVARRLRAQGSKAKIAFISASRDSGQASACLEAGGDASLLKTRMATDLIYAIKEVLAGRRFVSPAAG